MIRAMFRAVKFALVCVAVLIMGIAYVIIQWMDRSQ